MPGICKFQHEWLTKPHFKEWLGQASKNTEAKCNVCMSIIDISSMGIGALKSHMKGKRHEKALESRKSALPLEQLVQPNTNTVNVNSDQR